MTTLKLQILLGLILLASAEVQADSHAEAQEAILAAPLEATKVLDDKRSDRLHSEEKVDGLQELHGLLDLADVDLADNAKTSADSDAQVGERQEWAWITGHHDEKHKQTKHPTSEPSTNAPQEKRTSELSTNAPQEKRRRRRTDTRRRRRKDLVRRRRRRMSKAYFSKHIAGSVRFHLADGVPTWTIYKKTTNETQMVVTCPCEESDGHPLSRDKAVFNMVRQVSAFKPTADLKTWFYKYMAKGAYATTTMYNCWVKTCAAEKDRAAVQDVDEGHSHTPIAWTANTQLGDAEYFGGGTCW